jgi:transcriptional regulator with XRE-family HTH domain
MSVILDAIKAEIERRGESLQAISRGSGISAAQLSRLMTGERGLSIGAAEQLAKYLGLRIRIERTTQKGK